MKKVLAIILAIVTVLTFNISAFAETKTAHQMGDVNADGKVSASDARLVLRVAARLDSATENIITYGDIDGDGKISASDARTVLRAAANLEKLPSVEQETKCTDHDMKEKVIAPTCSEDGYSTKVCAKCGFTDGKKTNITPKTYHNFKFDKAVKSTCDTVGGDYYKCTNCDAVKKDNVQPKTGHSFKKGNVVSGTCISDGYTEYKCSACGTTEKRDLTKAGGHKYETMSEKRVTLNSGFEGFMAEKKCKYCKDVIIAYTSHGADMQIATVPISSSTAKAIQEKFDIYNYEVEGYDIIGKTVVIYGAMRGVDITGRFYHLDGTLWENCDRCGKIAGFGNNMCSLKFCGIIMNG